MKALIIICLLLTGCSVQEPKPQLFDAVFKCDMCGAEKMYKDVPSGFSVPLAEVEGAYLYLCPKCLGIARGKQYEKQEARNAEVLEWLKEEEK